MEIDTGDRGNPPMWVFLWHEAPPKWVLSILLCLKTVIADLSF